MYTECECLLSTLLQAHPHSFTHTRKKKKCMSAENEPVDRVRGRRASCAVNGSSSKSDDALYGVESMSTNDARSDNVAWTVLALYIDDSKSVRSLRCLNKQGCTVQFTHRNSIAVSFVSRHYFERWKRHKRRKVARCCVASFRRRLHIMDEPILLYT